MLLKVEIMHSAYVYIPSVLTWRLNCGQLWFFLVNATGQTPGGSWIVPLKPSKRVTSASEEVSVYLTEASSPVGHLIPINSIKIRAGLVIHMMVACNTLCLKHGSTFCKRYLLGQAPHDHKQPYLFGYYIFDMGYCMQANPPHVSPNQPSTHWHSKPFLRSVQRPQ